MIFNRSNEIGYYREGGASKLGEGISKLLKLTSLNLNFR